MIRPTFNLTQTARRLIKEQTTFLRELEFLAERLERAHDENRNLQDRLAEAEAELTGESLDRSARMRALRQLLDHRTTALKKAWDRYPPIETIASRDCLKDAINLRIEYADSKGNIQVEL